MGRTRPLAVVLIILTIVGFVLLAMTALTAYRSFTIRSANFQRPGQVRVYSCGSVLSPRDLRNLVSSRRAVPKLLGRAYTRCEATRSHRSKQATRYLIVGAVLLITAFSIPAIRRAQRRRKHRPRKMYRV